MSSSDTSEKRKIATKKLAVGMYVNLGKSWLHHSFLKPNFKITSESQIRKILKNGISEVTVDFSKSDLPAERDLARDVGITDKLAYIDDPQRGMDPPEHFNPVDLVSEALRETIENTSLPPQTKAKAVYDHSVNMMNSILEEPNAENILSGKKMIAATVDFILADEETAGYMSKITSHDYYTYTHSVNVGMLSILLAKQVFKGTYGTHNMRELGAGFFLHDLGKCDVPNSLINKAAPLNEVEWETMRNHPARGNQLLMEANQLSIECGLIVMQHHEREDGSGYPFGKLGDEIHIYGRICTIADVYDALTSTRAYKKKMAPFEALKVMKEEMLHHFHPELFGEFVQLFH